MSPAASGVVSCAHPDVGLALADVVELDDARRRRASTYGRNALDGGERMHHGAEQLDL